MLARLTSVKKIHQRCGGSVRLYEPATGSNLGAFVQVIETADWKAFGEYRSKLAADTEFKALMAEIQNNKEPMAELVSVEVVEEIPLG